MGSHDKDVPAQKKDSPPARHCDVGGGAWRLLVALFFPSGLQKETRQQDLRSTSGHVAELRSGSRVLEVLVLAATQQTDVAAELSEGLCVALMVHFTP